MTCRAVRDPSLAILYGPERHLATCSSHGDKRVQRGNLFNLRQIGEFSKGVDRLADKIKDVMLVKYS